jgi:hypothetical protein
MLTDPNTERKTFIYAGGWQSQWQQMQLFTGQVTDAA